MEEHVRVLNIKTKSIITANELEQFQQSIDSCVKLPEFQQLEKHISESHATTQEEFDKMYEQFKVYRKEMHNMLTKNELFERLQGFTTELNQKIDQRPTKEVVNTSLTKLDKKFTNLIDEQKAQTNLQFKKVQERQDRSDDEIFKLTKELSMLSQELLNKLTRQDGQRLWKHFQRFCEYEDLKDLYGRVMPQIANFEDRLLDF